MEPLSGNAERLATPSSRVSLAGDARGLLMVFHLRLCLRNGNRYLEQSLHRLLVPLAAFVVIRVHAGQDDPGRWDRSIEQHRKMLQAIRSGGLLLPEQIVRHSIGRIFPQTSEVLASRGSLGKQEELC
jgi:DNA-binding GntR family transcriptional regulator